MKTLPYFLILLFIGAACNLTDNNDSPPFNASDEWLLPTDEVVSGGVGVDDIPSIDNPNFALAGNTSYVDEQRLVAGVRVGNTIKAYPHQVLDQHEIINDQIGDTPLALTHCPLTGTSIAWNREINGEAAEFGVSGLLFRNNLIPYDRSTGSLYSQMQIRSVSGSQIGTSLESISVVQTTWKVWKAMYPESDVLTTNTGFNKDYNQYTYGKNYLEGNSDPLFSVQNPDTRLQTKEQVHGIIGENVADKDANVHVYVIDEFGSGIHVIEDQISGRDIVVAGSSDLQFAVSFQRTLNDGTTLQFEAVQDALPIIMKDQEGNRWDIFGFAVEGPRTGSRLTATNSYTGYWFAWADFFPNLEIHQLN